MSSDLSTEPGAMTTAPTSSEKPVVLDFLTDNPETDSPETQEKLGKDGEEGNLLPEESQIIAEAEQEVANLLKQEALERSQKAKQEAEKKEKEEKEEKEKQAQEAKKISEEKERLAEETKKFSEEQDRLKQESEKKDNEKEQEETKKAKEEAGKAETDKAEVMRKALVKNTIAQRAERLKATDELKVIDQAAKTKAAGQQVVAGQLEKIREKANTKKQKEQAQTEKEKKELRRKELDDQHLATQNPETTVGSSQAPIDWDSHYPDLSVLADEFLSSQVPPNRPADEQDIRKAAEGFMESTLQAKGTRQAPKAPIQEHFVPDPNTSLLLQAAMKKLHQSKFDGAMKVHERALDTYKAHKDLEEQELRRTKEAAVLLVLDSSPLVNECLSTLESQYVTPMLKIIKESLILKEIMARNSIRYMTLSKAYLTDHEPVQKMFQLHLRESPFSKQQVEHLSNLMGLSPNGVVAQAGIFGSQQLPTQERQSQNADINREDEYSDASTGEPPSRVTQNVELETPLPSTRKEERPVLSTGSDKSKDRGTEVPGKESAQSLGSNTPGFRIPRNDTTKTSSSTSSSSRQGVRPPVTAPSTSSSSSKSFIQSTPHPRGHQDYFIGNRGRDDNRKRQREESPEREPRQTQGKGKGKGGIGGKGKTGGGKGKPNSDNWNAKKLVRASQNPPVLFNLLTKEQRLETLCPTGPRCEKVFTCGFKHTVQEYQAANARFEVEAKTSEKNAIKKVMDSYSLAEAVPLFAHVYANQEPFPDWNYPAPDGFHNKRRTDEDIFVD
jgi:hypothetical protein